MSDLRELESRFENVVERMREITKREFSESPGEESKPSYMLIQIRRLAELNTQLERELNELRMQRRKDASELDDMIDILKPILGESAHA